MAEIPPAVALAIERFSPKSVSEEVALFSKELTFAAGPTTQNRAKAFLFASSRIGSYAQSLGLDLDPAVVTAAMRKSPQAATRSPQGWSPDLPRYGHGIPHR